MKQLEARSHCPDMQDGLQARVHDPLWLLARQWQTGEFKADDAGSPVGAFLKTEISPISRYRLGAAGSTTPAKEYSSNKVPLETIVEREAVAPPAAKSVRAAAQAGLHYSRLLGVRGMAKHVAAIQAAFQLAAPTSAERMTLDIATVNYLAVMAQRAIDGAALYAKLVRGRQAGGQFVLPADAPFTTIATNDRAAVAMASAEWLDWYDSRFSQPAGTDSAWVRERMEYAFAISGNTSKGEMALAASEYRGGRLDWYAFDIDSSQSFGAGDQPVTTSSVVLPAPVTFRGMPSSRFWEMEEGSVNLAQIEGAPHDVARALLVSFALEFGNDWFVVPVDMPVGSLAFVRTLIVTNTFGEKLLVRHTTAVDGTLTSWRMFGLSAVENSASAAAAAKFGDGFFLPPAVGWSLEGEAVEDVLFLRDEMANMAWAVERTVESVSGRRLDRHQAAAARRTTAPVPVVSETGEPRRFVYRLGGSVPDFWIPFLPVQAGGVVQLRRGTLPGAQPGLAIQPLGRILDPGRELLVRDEEVPREGTRVTRSYQYARWADGSTHLWMGRRKQPGRGEGSSGLRFDILE